ncbi:MAG: hypothetical protein AABZ06_13460 [Bdellovibrionota bacterium]
MSNLKNGNCWNCKTELSELEYGRGDTCRKCGRDTKTCKGCKFFYPSFNNECRESQAERVLDKERSNFCDYFQPRSSTSTSGPSAESIKSAAESLFKKN